MLEQQGYLVHFCFVAGIVCHLVQGCVVSAYDFVLTCLLADLVVADAEAHHVHAHVCGGLVGALAVDAFEECVEYGEDFYVAVVVDGHFVVGIQMEGVYHVHVAEVCGCGFVGDVDGVLQREVPDGEGLELGIAGFDAALVLLVELAEADGHLAAAGSGGCDDDQRTGGLDVVVASEAFFRVNQLHVVGIAFYIIMVIGTDADVLEASAIDGGTALAVEVSDDDAADQEASLLELGAQAQHVFVVGDAQVLSDLVLLDVEGTDDDDYLSR